MRNLPSKLKLTRHARVRIEERTEAKNNYYTKDLLKSPCRWYTQDELIKDSRLYKRSLYVCRKSKQFRYITDGELEIVYNKSTGIVITVLQFKEKFKPFMQFVKPELIKSQNLKIDYMDKQHLIISELCSFIKQEIEKKEIITTQNFQPRNIVYREKTKKAPMSITEFFETNDKLENIKQVSEKIA